VRESRGSRVSRALLASTAVVLLLPAAASATPAWLPPVTVAAEPGAADIAVDSAGNAVAVWTAEDQTAKVEFVRSAFRPAGGSWGPAETISAATPIQFKCAGCLQPRVAMDGSGRAVAIWSSYDQTMNKRRIILKTRPAGGSWSSISSIISNLAYNASRPRLAVNAAGDMAAVWLANSGTTPIVQAWNRPADGHFVPLTTPLSASNSEAFAPDVVLDASGTAYAAWGATGSGLPSESFVVGAARVAGDDSVWGMPQAISAVGGFELGLAVGPSGDGYVVWSRTTATAELVEGAARPAGAASWGAAEPIGTRPTAGAFTQSPQVVLSPSGDATVVWVQGAPTRIATARKAAGAAVWGTPSFLSLPQASQPDVAVTGAGDIVAVWLRGATIEAAARPASGDWTGPENVSETDADAGLPRVAVDAAGNATAAWGATVGSTTVVRSAVFDAAGPRFDSPTIPTSGTAGIPLTFAVSPFDVWSALGPGPVWSFGDGSNGAGASVSHTYLAPGTYTVAVAQSDAVGNVTTARYEVAIAAPPPPPPGVPPPPPGSGGVTQVCLVPNVTGKTLAKAKSALAQRHCGTGKVTPVYSKKVARGLVVSQSPKAGRSLKAGAKVNLVVSRGKRPNRH
jgi:hypothetical protein